MHTDEHIPCIDNVYNNILDEVTMDIVIHWI